MSLVTLNRRVFLAGTAATLLVPASAAFAQGWAPTKTIELISDSDAGGGGDRQTRETAHLLEQFKLVPTSVTVLNKSGGSGAAAVAYMNSHGADPHFLVQMTNEWFTDAVLNNNQAKLEAVTPLFKLLTVTSGFYVRADSDLSDAQAIVAKLKQDPGSVTFAMGATPGSDNWVSLMRFGLAAGIDPSKIRVGYNDSGSETIAQVLGGHVDVGIGGLGGTMKLMKAGKLRNIGLMSPDRLTSADAKDLKTLREQGIDAVANNWRAILGPKDMTPDQIAYWAGVFHKMVATDEFKTFAENNFAKPEDMGPEELTAYFKGEAPKLRKIMEDLGVAE